MVEQKPSEREAPHDPETMENLENVEEEEKSDESDSIENESVKELYEYILKNWNGFEENLSDVPDLSNDYGSNIFDDFVEEKLEPNEYYLSENLYQYILENLADLENTEIAKWYLEGEHLFYDSEEPEYQTCLICQN